MKTIFKHPLQHKEYENNGFIVMPLLDHNEIRELKQLYASSFRMDVRGLYTTHSHGKAERNIEVHNLMTEITNNALGNVFKDFEFNANHYVTKSNINSTEFRLHQDWNIVDEDNVQEAHIWCPLADAHEENGGIFVIRKSHQFFNNIRSGSMGIQFINRTPFINENITTLNIKAGEALIYKEGLFHGSFPNISNELRIVSLLSIREKGEHLVYYQKNDDYFKNGLVDVYLITTELLLNQLSSLEKGVKPVGAQCIDSFLYNRIATENINELIFEESLRRNLANVS